tara:strand:+ start:2614 stop:2997 length:384 start_codon:yes stop_codon:yes gene_type:complete
MRIKQNTYGLDKNFLITLTKLARVPTNNLVVKVQRSSLSTDSDSKYGNSSGICFRSYNGKPFIGIRITKDATKEHIGRLWLHELSHHRDNLKRARDRSRGIFGKHWGGEKKADNFSNKIWNKYLLII